MLLGAGWTVKYLLFCNKMRDNFRAAHEHLEESLSKELVKLNKDSAFRVLVKEDDEGQYISLAIE